MVNRTEQNKFLESIESTRVMILNLYLQSTVFICFPLRHYTTLHYTTQSEYVDAYPMSLYVVYIRHLYSTAVSSQYSVVTSPNIHSMNHTIRLGRPGIQSFKKPPICVVVLIIPMNHFPKIPSFQNLQHSPTLALHSSGTYYVG